MPTRLLHTAGLLCLLLGLQACTSNSWNTSANKPAAPANRPATPTNETAAAVDMPRSKSGNPPFYEVYGVRYTVMNNSTSYREQGVASWYGKKFHGRSTSSGEIYDMHAMTAAHKTLPLPTNVRVTNLETGKSIILRVNDRGPFVKNRLIDLSYAAALELDVVAKGTALVEVVALNSAYLNQANGKPTTAAIASAEGSNVPMYLQVGAFGEVNNAQKMADRLTANGIKNVRVHKSVNVQPTLYRVRIGPVHSVSEYDNLTHEIEELQIAAGHLVVATPDDI